MNLDDLKQTWQQQTQAEKISEKDKKMIAEIQQNSVKFDKKIKRRDLLETYIALLLVPIWAVSLFFSVSTLQTIGYIIAIVSCLYIPYRLRKAKQVVQPKNDENVRAHLLYQQRKLGNQLRLLKSVVSWYLMPILSALVFITLGGTVNEQGWPEINGALIAYFIGLGVLSVFIYVLNQKAVTKELQPEINEINEQLAELDNNKEGNTSC